MAGKGKAGRPLIPIDRDQFEKLCGLQCTLAEIASFFRCSEDTIERWCKREYKTDFADVFRQKREYGKISLRRSQMQAAENGNATLLIWLGKQYLNQTDTQSLNLNVNKLDPAAVEAVDDLIIAEREAL